MQPAVLHGDCELGRQVDLPQASCSTPSGQRSELEFSTMPSEGTPDFPSTANVFADSSAAGASGAPTLALLVHVVGCCQGHATSKSSDMMQVLRLP